MPNARHSSATPRWGTPQDIVERARRVMGEITLDPCTETKFEQVVRATINYSLLDRNEDGLELPWFGHVFCNPPGGLVRQFWRRALSQDIIEMIWVGFSVEQLCVLADEDMHPTDFSTCLLRSRIGFERHDGYQGAPSHGNYICSVNGFPDRFEQEFGPLGKINHGKFVHSPMVR